MNLNPLITDEPEQPMAWLADTISAAGSERQFLRSLVDALPDHIYVKDTGCRFVLTNAAVARLVGVESPEQMMGKTDFDYFPVTLAAQFFEEEQALLRSGTAIVNRETRVVTVAGGETWLLTTKVLLRGQAGELIGIVGINRDITTRKKHEIQLRQLNDDLARSQRELVEVHVRLQASHKELKSAQMKLVHAAKMESVGLLAAGVAHEVKNPLATILMGVEYLGDGLAAGDENVPVVISGIREAALRADGIVRGLLDFSAPNRLELTEEYLNTLCEKVLLLVGYDLVRKHFTIRRQYSTAMPRVPVDRLKIEQVILNLCLNAVQAMPDGGELSLTTRAESEHQLTVEIADTGPGIPEPELARIFEPFFTTKAASMGSGLGLAVAKTIIELHHGTITLENRPTGGVLARFTIPVARKDHHE